MPETVGFTGTRSIAWDDHGKVSTIVRGLPPETQVVVGGCIGVDALVARAAFMIYPVKAIIPADRSRVDPGWRAYCDTFELMPDGTDYRARNQRIVDLSDRLIAIADHNEDDPQSRRSGTWMTVRIARRAGKQVDVNVLCSECRRTAPPAASPTTEGA